MFPCDLNKLLFNVLLSIKARATICSLYTSDLQNDIKREKSRNACLIIIQNLSVGRKIKNKLRNSEVLSL